MQALDRSRTFMIVFSKGFIRSKWCKFEADLAQLRFLPDSKKPHNKCWDKRSQLLVIRDNVQVLFPTQ